MRRSRWAPGRILGGLLLVGIAAGAGYYAVETLNFGCPIKGNISYRTGERIYHLPGGEFYHATFVNPLQGERWFCSEGEAQAAGWRPSRR